MERKQQNPILLDRAHILRDEDPTTEEMLYRLISTVKYYGYMYLTDAQKLYDCEGYEPYSFLSQLMAMHEFERRLYAYNVDRKLSEANNRTVNECQELVIAKNIEDATTVFVESVKEEFDIEAPRDTINKWCMRKYNSILTREEFNEDSQLVEDIQLSVPYPFLWIRGNRECYNYVRLYNIALKQWMDKGRISSPVYVAAINQMRALKDISNLHKKIQRLQEIRAYVSSFTKTYVFNKMQVVILKMNRIVLRRSLRVLHAQCPDNPNAGNLLIPRDIFMVYFASICHEPPVTVQYRYEFRRCRENYYMYTVLHGCKSKNLQMRVVPDFYQFFGDDYVELFASPLNHIKLRWCSMFPMDRRYGSEGNAFSQDPRGKYLAHPPFMMDMMDKILSYFKEAGVMFLIMPFVRRSVEFFRVKSCRYIRFPKEFFPYEQLLPKGKQPGEAERFHYLEDTLLVYWGTQVEEINRYLNYFREQYHAIDDVQEQEIELLDEIEASTGQDNT